MFKYPTQILTDRELDIFLQGYDEVKDYILRVEYMVSFDQDSFLYSNTMLLCILYKSFLVFLNKLLTEYSYRNFNDNDIYDIFDSSGLSNLKQLRISTLRRLIRRLPILITKKGSNEAFREIINLFPEREIVLKRFFLNKVYKTENNKIVLDNINTYESNVDLKFTESTILPISGSSNISSNYSNFIKNDLIWGGLGDVDKKKTEVIDRLQDNLKKLIINTDFSRVPTKYLSISVVNNNNEVLIRTYDLLHLIFQMITEVVDNSGYNILTEERIFDFNNEFNVSPSDVYAAYLWANATFGNTIHDGIDYTDAIKLESNTIPESLFRPSKTMLLRDRSDLTDTFISEILNTEIDTYAYETINNVRTIRKTYSNT